LGNIAQPVDKAINERLQAISNAKLKLTGFKKQILAVTHSTQRSKFRAVFNIQHYENHKKLIILIFQNL